MASPFYSPAVAGPILEALLPTGRMWKFPQFGQVLARHYAEIVPDDGRERSGRQWNKHCNDATTQHLRDLEKQERLTVVTGRDAGAIPPVYEGAYFDSGEGRPLPIDEVAKEFQFELDNLNKPRDPLYVRSECAEVIGSYHKNDGRSEFHTSQILANAVDLRFLLAPQDDRDSQAAKSWTLKPLLPNVDEYRREYGGDAEIEIDKEQITVCTPYIPDWFVDISCIKSFLLELDERLRGKRYILCSPLGFYRYKKRKEALPWRRDV